MAEEAKNGKTSEESSNSVIQDHDAESSQSDSSPSQKRNTLIAAFRGPLPPPSLLNEYDSIVPGSAKDIVEMVKKEQEHRHYIQKKQVDTESDILQRMSSAKVRNSLIGVVSGFILGTLAIAGGVYLALNDLPIVGSIFAGVGLAPIVTSFIYGTRIKENIFGESPTNVETPQDDLAPQPEENKTE